MADDDRWSGLGEGPQHGFVLDDPVAFTRLMLDIYGHRCAITGRSFAPTETSAHPQLTVFLLQPMEHGGTMTLDNALLLEIAAASLMRAGIVQINENYESFVATPEVAPGLSLEGTRKLALPENPLFWPSRDMLAYHRSLFKTH